MDRQTMLSRRDYQLMQKIGARIVQYRKQLGITQDALAEKAGVGLGHLGRVERGMSVASLPMLFTVSEALEIPVKALFDFPEDA